MSSEPPSRPELDVIDRRILAILQDDAALTIAEIASLVGLSQTPCWRRIQRLEREGVILRRAAILDHRKVGLSLTALVFIKAPDHSTRWLAHFAEALKAFPEIVEAHRLAGDIDYVLQVIVADMAAYDRFYARLIAAAPLKSVTTRFALEDVKQRGPLPL